MNTMELIARTICSANCWETFSTHLEISKNVLFVLENCVKRTAVRVFHLLKYWTQGQQFSVHKLSVVGSALDKCHLNRVSLDICRGTYFSE